MANSQEISPIAKPPVQQSHFSQSLDNALSLPNLFVLLGVCFFLLLLWLVFYIIAKNLASELAKNKTDSIITSRIFEMDELFGYASNAARIFKFSVPFFVVTYFFYHYVKVAGLESHVTEWMNLLVRWVHLIAGISWIGASFYFIFLENSLNRTVGLRSGIAGNLWAIHGGGFYFLEKYQVAPAKIPKDLHWFKYEAYFTWITGFLLLWIVYYLNADLFLIDPSVADLSPSVAVGIGVGVLIVSWFVYDFLCKSPLVDNRPLFSLLIFVYIRNEFMKSVPCSGIKGHLSSLIQE